MVVHPNVGIHRQAFWLGEAPVLGAFFHPIPISDILQTCWEKYKTYRKSLHIFPVPSIGLLKTKNS